MAVFTQVSLDDAQRISTAHEIGDALKLDPIEAGSVNSNYYLTTSEGKFFLRVYEEQQTDGLMYEWSLLQWLSDHGLPVANVVTPLEPGSCSISGRPVGVFHLLEGDELCTQAVTRMHMEKVGRFLGHLHTVGRTFPTRRESRFSPELMIERSRAIDTAKYSEVRQSLDRIAPVLKESIDFWHRASPRGVIHSDLFRDNIKWHGGEILGVIDWESASDGPFIYDLMVTALSWCFSDSFRWDCVGALFEGYRRERKLTPDEAQWIKPAARYVAARFTLTRITDFHIHESIGPRVHKDYRRFEQRLDAVDAQADEFFRTLIR